MDLSKLSEPLTVDQIDFRIQSINKGGYATILAYKDARVDMQRLNDAVGPLYWKREHTRDNHNCIVSIYNKDIGQWVSKEDTGVESNTQKEKGLASDSFKRACFNWGIGQELYDYPAISVPLIAGDGQKGEWFLNQNKKDRYGNPMPQAGWGLKLKEWKWYSEFVDGKISYLSATDDKGNMRFNWGNANEAYSKLVENLSESITVIKQGIGNQDLSTAKEAWDELTDEEKTKLWKAPSKGGIFTTEERKIMQTPEFREANK